MKVTFIGATHEVTGSCTLIEVNNKNILVDCGMEQGADIFENIDIPVEPTDIDAVVLTHAHIDHSGKLPFIVSNGFNAPIYSSEATKELCDIMLLDSAHIQEFEAEWRNRKGKRAGREDYIPLYTTQDALNTMQLFKPFGYGEKIKLFDGVEIEFIDAGHLLGSCNVLFTMNEGDEERTILFSGDLGNIDKPLIRSPQEPPVADYLVCESTYGDRSHDKNPDYIRELTEIIQRTLDRGGNLVIPAFAVGRTQDLLYYLRIIKEKNLVKNHPDFPVYVDSPLAVEATNIYSNISHEYYDEEAFNLVESGINPVTFPDLKLSVTSDESRFINADATPKVIISASGMCEAGRIRHHLKHNLWRPECTILFVGYQSPGTVGAKLLDGAENVKLFGEEITVQAEICRIEAFSSHADRGMLLEWIRKANPKKRLFINHGEDEITTNFAKDAGEMLGTSAVAPYSGEVWDLINDELTHKADIIPVIKKQAQGGIETKITKYEKDEHDNDKVFSKDISNESKKRSEKRFVRLYKSAEDLLKLVNNSYDISNKEIDKMTSEIEAIIGKYER